MWSVKEVIILKRLRDCYSVWFRHIQSHDVSCNSQAGHISSNNFTYLEIVLKGPKCQKHMQWKLRLSRLLCRTSLRFVLDQGSEMHVWGALLVFCSWFRTFLQCAAPHAPIWCFNIQKSSVREESEGLAGDSSHKDSKMTTNAPDIAGIIGESSSGCSAGLQLLC